MKCPPPLVRSTTHQFESNEDALEKTPERIWSGFVFLLPTQHPPMIRSSKSHRDEGRPHTLFLAHFPMLHLCLITWQIALLRLLFSPYRILLLTKGTKWFQATIKKKKKKKLSIFGKHPKVKSIKPGFQTLRAITKDVNRLNSKKNMGWPQQANDRHMYHLLHRLLSTLKIALWMFNAAFL